ncbi:hypothetical protein FACS189435_0860 [Bacteroidia bacterium]|nr:hypothetical protein FACS189435_0860 [Bacteroidia bacterium]
MLTGNNILFHNHTDAGLRYSYPLIQYKRLNGKAAIVCVEEGTESIGEFFSNIRTVVNLGNQEIVLELDTVKAEKVLVQVWVGEFVYSLRKWLPLNQDNYEKFRQIEDLKSKCEFLEKVTIGNILSFAKGINIHFEQEVKVDITSLEENGAMKYKNISFASFDVMFKTNVSLPNYIGLGKGVSHGFGTVVCLNRDYNKI